MKFKGHKEINQNHQKKAPIYYKQMINFRNATYHLLEWHMRKENVPADTSILQIIYNFYLLLNPVITNVARMSSIQSLASKENEENTLQRGPSSTFRSKQNKALLYLHLKVFLVASLIERLSREAESVVVPNASATSKTGNFPIAIRHRAKLFIRATFLEP